MEKKLLVLYFLRVIAVSSQAQSLADNLKGDVLEVDEPPLPQHGFDLPYLENSTDCMKLNWNKNHYMRKQM